MTIRSLAADLNVAPMTLYRHVRDKDDILDEVADRLLSKSWRPRGKSADCWDWITDAAERLRHLLVTQPAVLHVYLSHPVVSTAALTRMEATLDVLQKVGFDEKAARRAYAAIHTYTVGFAALQASRSLSPLGESTDETAKQLAEFTTKRQFSDGLGYLIEGVQRHTRSDAD